jgi:hypothetical protein
MTMFNRAVHVIETAEGEKWINVDALLWVIAAASTECQARAILAGTAQATSVAAVIGEYSTELRLAIMRL